MFAALGQLAVDRGRDAAGFACVLPPSGRPGRARRPDPGRRDVRLGRVRIIKDTQPFNRLWDDRRHRPIVDRASIALGHTRWATQGEPDALVNTSPLCVGALVGTHNGDVTATSIPGFPALPSPAGSTDTERVYQAVDRDRKDRRQITRTLAKVHGRVALAWIDRTRPDRVYLARAALSPLAVAFDADGNFFWASNPQWFRQIDERLAGTVGFHDITLLREGSLLTVSATGTPTVEDIRQFHPTCRKSDTRLPDHVVWRGFDAEDVAVDKAQTHHRVARPARRGRPAAVRVSDTVGTVGYPRTWVDRQCSLNLVFSDQEPDVFDPTADLTSDVAADEALLTWADDEADEALLAWAEQGFDLTVVDRVRHAVTPASQTRLAAQFGLSSALAFGKFRSGLLAWHAGLVESAG